MSFRWLFGGSLVVIVVIACGDPSHIFQGRAYLDARNCLGTTSSVDVVDGDDPGTHCPQVCLAQSFVDGGRELYVSSMCGPFPFTFDASGNDFNCAAALAAFNRDDTCNVDGTSTHPLEAGADTGTDAGVADAATD